MRLCVIPSCPREPSLRTLCLCSTCTPAVSRTPHYSWTSPTTVTSSSTNYPSSLFQSLDSVGKGSQSLQSRQLTHYPFQHTDFHSGNMYFTTIRLSRRNYNGGHLRHPGRLTKETISAQTLPFFPQIINLLTNQILHFTNTHQQVNYQASYPI